MRWLQVFVSLVISVVYVAGASTSFAGFFASYGDATVLDPFIECENINRMTGKCTCEAGGFTSDPSLGARIVSDGTGTTNEPGYLFYCASSMSTVTGWGGMYQRDADVPDGQGCRYPNPYTGACSCPSGYQSITTQIMTDTVKLIELISSNVTFCWSNPSSSATFAFGGVYQKSSSDECLTSNPATGSCSCSSEFPITQMINTVVEAGVPHKLAPIYICERGVNKALNVHAVPHTHDDPGWLKTVDGYYDCCVQYILDTVVSSLAANPKRRFTYVEMAFFTKWWEQQTEETKSLVQTLVKNGQLDFTIGGWVMPDEACPSYIDLIDQMTAGHLFLKETFGEDYVPSVGWQIDPFGHSNGNTWTYSQFGFDFNVVMRIDHQDLTWRRANVDMEFIWRPFQSFDSSQDILSFELYDGYGWPPGRISIFDLTENKTMSKDDIGPDEHVVWEPEPFAHWAYNAANSFKTNEILAPMGSDFKWQDAEPEFSALDDLISYFETHPEYGINMFYSSPTSISKAIMDYDLSLSVKTSDFFGYSDSVDSYWSGYFTSHPAFKRYVRASSALFTTARAIHALASADPSLYQEYLTSPWHAIAVTQHHDAITGTSKSFVYDDYLSQLDVGNNASASAILKSLSVIDKDIEASWEVCPPVKENPSYCEKLAKGDMVSVINSLALLQDIPINLQVTSQNLCAYLTDGTSVPSQTRLAPWVGEEVLYELSFIAEGVPPLGIVSFVIDQCNVTTSYTRRQLLSAGATVTIENEFYTLSFDSTTNTLSKVLDKIRGVSMPVDIDVLYYVPEGSPYRPQSGAYVFAADTPPNSFPGPRGSLSVFSGEVYQEVEVVVDSSSNVIQRFRLYKNDPTIAMFTTVGPIDIADRYGKEVIVRLNSTIASSGVVYTDSHNLEFQERVYNVLYDDYTVENPISGNYYPISSATYIKDSTNILAVVPDRAQGAASLGSGSLEVMVHRRLLTDGDKKGVGEPLNDSSTICTKQLLVFTDASDIERVRSATRKQEHIPVLLSSEGSVKSIQFEPMATPLPENIDLTTLQVTQYDMFGASTILRLHHTYAVGEDAVLSQPVTINLADLFVDWVIETAVEVTLSAAHKVGIMESLIVTLDPMSFRTFAITMVPV
ncbi:Lysosomal alpha-mannosidase [Pelomyxa schiedti]|nr:Lysosomal alpha-mannosidase [Pelomyxa schiedti]